MYSSFWKQEKCTIDADSTTTTPIYILKDNFKAKNKQENLYIIIINNDNNKIYSLTRQEYDAIIKKSPNSLQLKLFP